MISSIASRVRDLKRSSDRPIILIGWGISAAINCQVNIYGIPTLIQFFIEHTATIPKKSRIDFGNYLVKNDKITGKVYKSTLVDLFKLSD
jgi:hypothetical protein